MNGDGGYTGCAAMTGVMTPNGGGSTRTIHVIVAHEQRAIGRASDVVVT